MNRKEFLIITAKNYLAEGLNVIAVDGQKKAIAAWKMYAEDLITVKALEDQINSDKAEGIATICGAVSGNMEVMDFDLKYDITGNLMANYKALIPAEIMNKLRIIETRSGGFHWLYRCEVIEGNQKLASRPATPSEIKDSPHLKQLVLIETRGEGGYVVAPPTDGYTIIQDNPIPVISVDERDVLLDAARSFMEIHIEERAKFTSTGTPFTISPFDDYNLKTDAIGLLTRHGWTVESEHSGKVFLKRPGTSDAKNSGNFHNEKKLLYVWTTSTEFEPGRAYSPSAIYCTLTHGGDYSAASRQLIKEGYGTRKTPESVKEALKVPLELDFKFWEVIEGKKGATKIEVSLTKLSNYIHKVGGFSGYKYNEQSENIIVQVKDGLVEEVDIYNIKQFLKNSILALPDTFDGITPEELLEVIYREHLAFVTKGFMDFLDVSKLDFLRDTEDKAFFPFKNGIVEVNKTGAKFHKYGEFKQVLWRSQLINKNITLTEDLANKLDFPNIDYARFIEKVSGDNLEKEQYFISVIGHLLHKFKDETKSFAVILSEETENESEGGGTGKGLFVKAIKELIPTEIFDGKQFSAGKAFAFQRVSLDTKLIAIEDAKKFFKFEELYSQITEGITVEKKNQKEFFIPYADSPKITISTNYTITAEAGHAERRQRVLEFSNFFSPALTPKDYFNHKLFSGWDNDEWNRFYNYMFFCCQVYLESGILQVKKSDTGIIKGINSTYGEDLLPYFKNLLDNNSGEETVQARYNEFISTYGINSKDYKKVHFMKGIRAICKQLNYSYSDSDRKIEGQTQRVFKVSKAA